MKVAKVIFCVGCLVVVPVVAEERRYDQMFPKIDFREMLSLVAKFEEKPVIVEDPGVFQIESSLILPNATVGETLKVLHALILINGYELVERDSELHLTKVLTSKQCTAMMQAMGAKGEFPKKSELPIARVRVVRGRGGAEELPVNRVIVREPK